MRNASSKTRTLLLISAILLLANIALLVFCVWLREPAKKTARPERTGYGFSGFLEKEMGFSQDQLKQFETLRQDHRNIMKPLFDSLRASKERFYKLLNDPSANDSLIKIYAVQIGEKQQAVDLEIFRHFKTVRTICTPGQQVRYDSLVQGFLQRMVTPFRRMANPPRDSGRKASE